MRCLRPSCSKRAKQIEQLEFRIAELECELKYTKATESRWRECYTKARTRRDTWKTLLNTAYNKPDGLYAANRMNEKLILEKEGLSMQLGRERAAKEDAMQEALKWRLFAVDVSAKSI